MIIINNNNNIFIYTIKYNTYWNEMSSFGGIYLQKKMMIIITVIL